PGDVIPRYSRTAALGLDTDFRTMWQRPSSTNSSMTGWSYIECQEVTENGVRSWSAMSSASSRVEFPISRKAIGWVGAGATNDAAAQARTSRRALRPIAITWASALSPRIISLHRGGWGSATRSRTAWRASGW